VARGKVEEGGAHLSGTAPVRATAMALAVLTTGGGDGVDLQHRIVEGEVRRTRERRKAAGEWHSPKRWSWQWRSALNW
jgi:hypothetical protein